jgi:predicted pyridoxine 5'-phosphate oxidase superfamily flavin-nucleotide-binding protein
MEGKEAETAVMYHPGELIVQARANRRDMADRIGKSIRAAIPPAAPEFLLRQPMAFIGAVDSDGRPWASVLTGHPGFMQAVDDRTVKINARPMAGDPLAQSLAIGGQVGMVVIDFATRHRMRLNGRAEIQKDEAIHVYVQQVYANCPKYIQARQWQPAAGKPMKEERIRCSRSLTERQRRWIRGADTFFVASSHPDGGVDASHRGGNPGFVHVVNDSRLVWPDYSGNMMFQTLGNITVNPRTGLLFIDFQTGDTLQLTGQASINWDANRAINFPGAERLVEFDIEEVIELTNAIPLKWKFIDFSPFNPDR